MYLNHTERKAVAVWQKTMKTIRKEEAERALRPPGRSRKRRPVRPKAQYGTII